MNNGTENRVAFRQVGLTHLAKYQDELGLDCIRLDEVSRRILTPIYRTRWTDKTWRVTRYIERTFHM